MKTLAATEDLAEIRARIGRLAPGDTGQWGSMNAAQAVCHMRDSLCCPLGERMVAPLKPPIPPAMRKWLALWFPREWPRGVPTTPEMNQEIGGTRPMEFALDRAGLLEKLDAFAVGKGPWPAHPIFGAMTQKEWMRWGYLHADHHLRQFGR